MRPITLSAVLLLTFAAAAGAQSGAAREPCVASLERVLAGSAPDWPGQRCDRVVLAEATRRVRAAAQLADSARLDRLAGAAGWFRDPELFRGALALARDRRAAGGARALGLHIAFGQVHPTLMVLAREPVPPPPPRCGPDSAGRWTCVVSSGGGECSVGIAKRPAFAIDRPIPARLLRELQSLIHAVRDAEREPAGLRRLARCMLLAQGDGPPT